MSTPGLLALDPDSRVVVLGAPGPRCALSGPYYTPCTYADCDLDLGGGCVLKGPPA